ncbi:Phytochrome-like protein cph2 [Tsuneonella dongtanensis]|uniref:Phytochrome-like protein cph2 n=1 Tax=Tsuneonella dongtanensis TaxID=692370 RepID=A0A1B2AG77_9SPHN|nr:EAL domain-containing protein [Tsuneonella dongtanensis]ANY21035.1 Phytochrome-like protein cph2 [Tsuneonella dongtanensis]
MPKGVVKDNSKAGGEKALERAERDLVALGIAVAAILLFVGTGGMVLPQVVRSWMGVGAAPDPILVNALLLNIALVIFGWRRYAELTQEIAERRKAEELARQLAETDPLTGSLNRRSIGAATEKLLSVAHAEGRAVAFVMVDLDNFKTINDLNGHQAGDLLLSTTADRIRALLPRDSLLARLGGDEFACVIPYDPRFPDRIDQFACQLIERAGEPFDYDGLVLEITVSVGITSNLDTGAEAIEEGSAQALIHRADIAMYHAKKQGKNRYFWFEEPMESELRFRSELETGIRRGVARGEFVPYYEQQIDLETGALSGFEMLARWQSPTLGLVSPEVFIPVAEEIGVIAELSEQLIDRALADASEWDPRLSLSVNISPVQLRDPWFAQKILKLLVKHNFPPHRLDIEITESCLHENIGVVRSIITSLKNQGVTISLDDFGTGFSSLSQLRTLPFDRLKIDRSFVSEIGSADESDKLVRAIVSLGDGLDLPITAEGIEDTEILRKLRTMGQLKGQGYYYGRPEAIDAVRSRLDSAGLLAKREATTKSDPPSRAKQRKTG